MITVNVVTAFSTGDSVSVSVPAGSTVRDVASRVSAPASSQYRLMGSGPVQPTHVLGNGDTLVISSGKVDAGC